MFRYLRLTACALSFIMLTTLLPAQEVRDRNNPSGGDVRGGWQPGGSSRLNPQLFPPSGGWSQPQYWKLGVEVDYVDTGAQITRVYPRTAAARQGLEVGDLIVTINGYQVGIVDGQVYDIGDEFTLRADRFGRVRMLVQNRRDGRLVSMIVGLDPAGGGPVIIAPPVVPEVPALAAIRGSVSYRESIVLPLTSRLRVELIERDRPGGAERIVNEYVTRTLGQQKPLPYEITFRAADLDPRKFYYVRAYLDVARELTLYTPSEVRVIPQQTDRRIDLTLVRPR